MHEFYQQLDPPDIETYSPYPFPPDESSLDFLVALYKGNSILRYRGDAAEYMPAAFRESVAEHTLHVQYVSFVLLYEHPRLLALLDEQELTRFILFHDLGEMGLNGRDWTITDVVNGTVDTIINMKKNGALLKKLPGHLHLLSGIVFAITMKNMKMHLKLEI